MYILTCFKEVSLCSDLPKKVLLHFMLSDIDIKIIIRIMSIFIHGCFSSLQSTMCK